jgi:hypothetical protein
MNVLDMTVGGLLILEQIPPGSYTSHPVTQLWTDFANEIDVSGRSLPKEKQERLD